MLAVLAQAGKPLTVGEVAALKPRGSEIGVRRSLARLVEQGIVRATEMGRNRVHALNREHVAAPVAEALADLRLVLWKRFRSTLSGWNPKPVYGCVVAGHAPEFLSVQLTERQAAKWAVQVGQLHDLVRGWTGNPLQVVEMSACQWSDHRRRRTDLFDEISRDAIPPAGEASRAGSARTEAK